MTALITLADLNTVINHEPRVLDLLVAERLGFDSKYKIRELIDRNREELESYGAVSARTAETSERGGRPSTEYWLNEAQALLICTFSRTAKATAVRKALIEVYQAYRSGTLQPAHMYRASSEFKSLSQNVRKDYARYLDEIEILWGRFPAALMTRRAIMEWRDSMQGKAARANNALSVLRRLYGFGIDRGVVKFNPVLRVKKMKGGEYRPWRLEEIKAFRAHAPTDLALALDLALYTGQRQGDVLKMTWAQIHDGGIEVVQQKTGAKLWVPLHRDLRAALHAIEVKKAVTILTSPSGLPWKSDHFKHKFKKAARAAELPDDLVFHGLRKSAASFMAEAGCTTEQIKSITGHATDAMAAHYAKGAEKKILALAAMSKFEENLPNHLSTNSPTKRNRHT